MNKAIIYQKENGIVSIVHPSGKEVASQVSLSVIREGDSPEEITRKTKAIKAQKFLFAIMKKRKITQGEWIKFIVMKDIPDGVDYEIVDRNTIFKDRTFRNAWVKNRRTVEVDMPKARDIHMGRIREARDKELDDSDRELARELEQGPASKALKDKRKFLRDIPQNLDLDLVDTPEALKKVWPVDLPAIE